MREYWTIVHKGTKTPVVPFDTNPGSVDEGMLVYWSRVAADLACEHQFALYGVECKPCPLDKAKEPHDVKVARQRRERAMFTRGVRMVQGMPGARDPKKPATRKAIAKMLPAASRKKK